MIVYINEGREFARGSYDATYSSDLERFKHKKTFRALDVVFKHHLDLTRPVRTLDIGCGQGPVTRRLREMVVDRAAPIVQESAFYGIDVSEVAIRQCEQQMPQGRWILDSLQAFLERSDTPGTHHGRFDLVVNKGGLTYVTSEAEYRTMLAGIRDLLAPSGVYLYVQNKQFYQKWSQSRCGGWSADVFEIAADAFGEPTTVPDTGTYVHLYTKTDAPQPDLEARRRKLREIVFEFEDGSTRSLFVSGDGLTARRLEELTAAPDPDAPFAYPIPGKTSPRMIDELRRRRQRTVKSFRPGRPRVLAPSGPIPFETRASARNGFDVVFDVLHHRCNVVLWPETCLNTRHACRQLNRWGACRPDVLILGVGFVDSRIDIGTGMTQVDLDEFRYRAEWLVERSRTTIADRVVWLATPPQRPFRDRAGRFEYRPEVAREFNDVAAEVCSAFDVPFQDVGPLAGSLVRWRQKRALRRRVADLVEAQRAVSAV